ncbi:MAG: YdcH family protein [Gemmobacter sp.]
MTHTPHDLAEEFPHAAARIHDLRQSNAHFARLADEYHDVNRAVHRAETRVETLGEAAEAELRRRRMSLKDELGRMLAAP